jgi:hypothetical protein
MHSKVTGRSGMRVKMEALLPETWIWYEKGVNGLSIPKQSSLTIQALGGCLAQTCMHVHGHRYFAREAESATLFLAFVVYEPLYVHVSTAPPALVR